MGIGLSVLVCILYWLVNGITVVARLVATKKYYHILKFNIFLFSKASLCFTKIYN